MIPSIFWKWAAEHKLTFKIENYKNLGPEGCKVELFKDGESLSIASGWLTEEECVYRCLEGYFEGKLLI